jgi:ketopantoate reductase
MQELGRRTGVPTPTIDIVLTLIQQREATARQAAATTAPH